MDHRSMRDVHVREKLMNLHDRRVFCEVEVCLRGGEVVHAMAPMLSIMSQVFETMLTTDMLEKNSGSVRLDISKTAWDCAVEYYFGGGDLCTADNIQEVVSTSHMYQMDCLKLYCEESIPRLLTPHNCLSLQKVAQSYELTGCLERIDQYVASNFSEICKSDDFIDMSKDTLLEILSMPGLTIDEDDLSVAVFFWLSRNELSNEEATRVVSHLRVWEISSGMLLNFVLRQDFADANPDYHEAVRYELTSRFLDLEQYREAGTPRGKATCSFTPLDVLVLGDDGQDAVFLSYLFQKRHWLRLPPPPRSVGGACVFLDGCIMMTGGEDLGERTSTYVFDLGLRTWTRGPELNEGRWNHGMVTIGQKAYVVGGCSDYDDQNGAIYSADTVEEYQTSQRSWTVVGGILHGREVCAVAALGSTIIALGGTPTERTVQTFQVETRVAATLQIRLPLMMSHVRGFGDGDLAYFLGNTGDLVQVGRLWPESEITLTGLVRLREFRERTKEFQIYIGNQCLYVFGGLDKSSIESYTLQGQKLSSSVFARMPARLEVSAVINATILRP